MTPTEPTTKYSADDHLNALVAGLHAERKGRAWEGECPCHEYHRHLGISIRNDKVLVKCHGSPPASQGEVIAALHTLNLWPDNDPLAQPKAAAEARKANGPSNGEPIGTDADGKPVLLTGRQLVASYDYLDPVTGAVLGTKHRYEPKAFIWTGHNGRQMSDLPLFHADRLRKLPIDKAAILCEGEKAALAVEASARRPAFCGPGGAGQRDWGTALDALAGRPVVLWRDNDPPGEAWARYLALQLVGVASEVKEICTGQAPGDDAHDFFEHGGTVAELVRLVQEAPPLTPVTEPTLTRQADDAFEVTVPDKDGYLARFEFTNLATLRADDITGFVAIWYDRPGAPAKPFRARINVASTGKRDDIVKAIELHLDEYVSRGEQHRWARYLHQACSLVMEAVAAIDYAVDLGEPPDPNERAVTYVAYPLVQGEGMSMLFGPKGAGKSLIALLVAACVALGLPFMGRPTQRTNVLYLNYEATGKTTLKNRLYRLLMGLGATNRWAELKRHLILWNTPGRLLATQLPDLRRLIAEQDVGLAIVDSAGMAGGAEPERAETAITLLGAVCALGVPVLVLHHVRKDEAETASATPFGSGYWENIPRLLYHVRRDRDKADADDVELGLNYYRSNDGRSPGHYGLALGFEGEGGPITLKVIPLGAHFVRAPKGVTLAKRILETLACGAMTVPGLAEALGAPERQVRSRINELREDGRVTNVGDGRWELRVTPTAEDDPDEIPM